MTRILLSLAAGVLLVVCVGAQGIPFEQRARLFDYDAKAPLNMREKSVEEVEGVQAPQARVTPPPVEALCAQSEQMLFAKVDGKPVAYHVLGSGTGTPLLLINGGPGFPHTSLHLSAAWEPLAEGRRVIFFDQPGTGQSWPLGANDSLVVADVLASIEAIRQAIGAPRLAVLGHSWGGYVALAYAVHHPEHVQAVVLVGSLAPKLTATESLLGARFPERIAAEENLNPNNPADVETWARGQWAMSLYSGEIRDRVLAKLAGCPSGYVGRQETLLWKDAVSLDLSDDLPRLARPVLVMAGRYDTVSPRTAWKIHQAIPGSQYVILERSGHFPMIEEPDEFVAVVDRFLRSAK